MNIIQSALFGVVEGLTEFLPISSTAHLIITSKFFKIPQTDFQKFFEVFIQTGAILAVVFLYFQYILKHKYLIKHVILSFIPTAGIGFFLYKIIKEVFFESSSLMIDAIFFVGLLFLILEYAINRKKIILKYPLQKLTYHDALLTGFFQAIAVIPGVSRSGIVMFYLMCRGYMREEAALYSFLLAVPTIIAASGYDLFKMRHLLSSQTQYVPLILVGFVMSFFVAYIVMKWFIRFLQRNTLVLFGVYRLLLAIILMLFL